MKTLSKVIIGMCLSSIAWSLHGCQDIIEINISGKTVTLLSPADGLQTKSSTITFWWNTLTGAEQYELQIVSPSFAQAQILILDSLTTAHQLTLSLAPGNYQWRVMGVNNGGNSNYQTRSFTIDSTGDLTGQTVVLISPSNNLFTNDTAVTFKWDTLYNATSYRIQVLNQSNIAVEDSTINLGSISFDLPQGVYTWQVRAQNAISFSAYSSRTITVDTAAPVISIPSSPVDSTTLPNPIALVWRRDASTIGDSLFIATDTLFSTIVFSGFMPNTFYSYTGTSGQKYFWRLRSENAAGSWGGYSIIFRFIIQ